MIFEAETIEGLETYSADELSALFGVIPDRGSAVLRTTKGAVQFTYHGETRNLLALKSVIAVYQLEHFPVPRPKALMGHQHFTRLTQVIDSIRASYAQTNTTAFKTLYIDAAGADSSVMTRLKLELAAASGLAAAPVNEKGDLLIRLRRSKGIEGWDALVRLSPRPLATRAWRVCNYEGALNAAVACIMTHMPPSSSDDVFVNLMCGSGSLLVERLGANAPKHIYGCDSDLTALHCAVENLKAAGSHERIRLFQSDVRNLPFETGFASHLMADLPFGQLVGSHEENRDLYPAVLREAARIAAEGASFVLITHEIRLIEQVLRQSPHWDIQKALPITLSGLHPRIYWLRRTSAKL